MAIFSLGLSILFSLAIFFVYSPLKPVLGLTHELNQTAIKGQFDKGKYFEFTNVVTDYKKTDTSNHLTVFGAVKSNSPQNFKNVLLGLEVYNKQNALIYFVSEPIFYEDNAGGNSIFNFNVEINPSLEYDHYNLLVAAEPLVGFGLNHTNAQESITLVNYTDHQRNFMLQYPSDWNFTQRDDGSVLFHPILDTSKDKMLGMFKLAAFGPKITISLTNPLFPDMTSEELCNSYANFFENAGYTVYHKGEKILPNITDQACTVQYATEGEKNKAMKGERNDHPALLIIVMHEGIAYTIEYSSTVTSYFSSYINVMQELINSFKFIE